MLFFFQAEDGIRDGRVTGVQTCALPISDQLLKVSMETFSSWSVAWPISTLPTSVEPVKLSLRAREIGRASCRERVEISVVAGSLKKKRKRREGRWRMKEE